MSRPTKYKKEYCQKLIEHMAKGYSFESFSAVVNVNQDTLHEWAKPKVSVEFSEAKKEAFAKCRLFWETIGIDGMLGKITRKVQKVDSYGNKTTENVQVKIDVGMWIFNMKNRFGWKDRVEFIDEDEIEDMEFID